MESMTEPASRPLSGRRAQAARNDELILQAARAVFVSDPSAPISAVAERAGVGISPLYVQRPEAELKYEESGGISPVARRQAKVAKTLTSRRRNTKRKS